MTYETLHISARRLYPAIALESLFSRSIRSKLLGFLVFVECLSGFIGLISLIPSVAAFIAASSSLILAAHLSTVTFFVAFPFVAAVFMLYAYENSLYFRGLAKTMPERFSEREPRASFEVAAFCFGANPNDLTDSFLRFSYGQLMLVRAGLELIEIEQLRMKRTKPLSSQMLEISPRSPEAVRLYDLALALFHTDTEFAELLFRRGIQEKNFSEAAEWVSRDIINVKRRIRWWSRDNLGRIEGIGKDWSYGGAYQLRRYAHDMTADRLPSYGSRPKYIQDEVERIESALSKAKEANVLLVGEDGGSKMEVLKSFAALISEGKVFPILEHKKLYLLDANHLVADAKSKAEFEHEFIKMLTETAYAGNVILAIQDFGGFLTSVGKLGTNAVSLMSSYLDSPRMQFICLSNQELFHQVIEPDGLLVQKFETIILKEGESSEISEVLQDEASTIESKYGLAVPQPTLALIAESADRYITEGVMPDKAIDLLYELAAKVSQSGKKHIGRGDVLEFVKQKTGIPTGDVSAQEKERLVNLEKLLHERVVGQEEAVRAIANAMRRSRAGLSNANRPIGSFLFMGPTGVGKTETTKALAQAFFGDENRILRLDMSEYTAADSLSKLIGSYQANTPGVLTSMLREKPYGVLLLDEFEKTTREVMDLFLQVLDEGVFADMHGKKVNARNLIIIATSNAGSDMIYQLMQQGADLASKKDLIIDAIIKQGIFRPELVNRFDGVILFHPINTENLRDIAKMMLEKFRSRIKSRGIDLAITDELVDYLVRYGSDPKFGARPMNRAIQDLVEQKIADKIIRGDLAPGQKIELTAADLSE